MVEEYEHHKETCALSKTDMERRHAEEMASTTEKMIVEVSEGAGEKEKEKEETKRIEEKNAEEK